MDDPNFVASWGRFVIPAAISLVAAVITAIITVWSQTARLRHEFELQRDKLRTELKLEFATEEAIRDLLSDPNFEEGKRTFKVIQSRLGGFSDDELRKHLIRAGAVRYRGRTNGAELWGLRTKIGRDRLSADVEDGQ